MSLTSRFASLLALVGMALSAGPAFASTILTAADVGSSFTIAFDGNVEGSAVDGLSAEAEFTLTSFGETTGLDITLRNTSGDPLTASSVTSLGFDTSETLVSSSTSGAFDVSVLGSSYPNGVGSIDVCFKTGQANNCGGGNSGAQIGDELTFSILLGFNGDPGTLELDGFAVRYQGIAGPGFDDASGTGTPGSPIPEPSAAVVFAAGLLVARTAVRRRAR